jgi:hypothetical protein
VFRGVVVGTQIDIDFLISWVGLRPCFFNIGT